MMLRGFTDIFKLSLRSLYNTILYKLDLEIQKEPEHCAVFTFILIELLSLNCCRAALPKTLIKIIYQNNDGNEKIM